MAMVLNAPFNNILVISLPEWDSNSLLLVVKGSDCIGSCKSNYHTITTMTAPLILQWASMFLIFR
jgi:hypothetical protein